MMEKETRSATIYQFPVGGRDGQRAILRPASEPMPRVAYAVGESWYHAEAIADTLQAKPQ